MSEDKGGIIMKKLLLLGALLVVGATSFSAIASPTPDTDQTASFGDGASATTKSVGLNLITRGDVIAPQDGEFMLVISPTVNGGTDGKSIEFNFQNLIPGETRKVQGGFEAKIIEGAAGAGNDTDVKLTDEQKATFSTLFSVNGTEKDTQSIKLAVNDTTTKAKLGDLTYSVSSSFAGDSIRYVGVVEAEVAVLGNASAGSFMNSEADVVVKVTDLTLKPAVGGP